MTQKYFLGKIYMQLLKILPDRYSGAKPPYVVYN